MEVRDLSGTSSSVVHVGPAEGRAVRMPGAQLLTLKVSGEQTGGAYSLFEVAVAPKGGSTPHVHHREDECFYVLEGRFGFVIEDTGIEAGPGSLIYVPKGKLHAFWNTGETTGRMLVSQTPGGLYEGFVEEVGEQVTDKNTPPPTAEEPPEDAERLAAVGALYGVEMVPPLP
jgi:mannose-6-phosphate isomerase-like protein (cupin superfamily)